MKKFKDQPLSRKALTLGVVPAVCAVLLLASTSITLTYLRAIQNTTNDLASQASQTSRALGELVVEQKAAIENNLAVLEARPTIDLVCVFDTGGALFAAQDNGTDHCPPAFADTERAGFARVVVPRPIVTGDGRTVGTLVLTSNLRRFNQWRWSLLGALAIALLGGMLVGVFLTYRLQRAISTPVLELARTADAVTATRNYSLRAVQTTDDEVGGLVRSFNTMLDELQSQNEALTVEVAERKRAEELKDAFLAAVSHELRTPLNAILGRVQILRHTKPTEERLERSLESLERNARSQARLVEDLLDVSRIVSGKFQLRMDVVDLKTVVNQAVEVAAPQATARGVSVDVRTPAEPCLVSGDADRLQQAVSNLISNAIKFGNGTAVTLELAEDAGDQRYAITVEDGGVGIAADFLPHVFDRFRQADSSTTRQQGGLGLGLAIVREVVELHNGSVTASSRGPGQGACFTMRLPQLVTNERLVVPDRSPVYVGAPLHGLRLLVVDDEPDSLDIVATALTEAGADASRAPNGPDAVRLWKRGGFDALICDLAMPGMDGYTVLEQIRTHESTHGRIPAAVAVTAYASRDHRTRSLAAGFNAHLAKPYDTADLIDAVKTALSARTRDDEVAQGV